MGKRAFPSIKKGVAPKIFPGAPPPDPQFYIRPPHSLAAGAATVANVFWLLQSIIRWYMIAVSWLLDEVLLSLVYQMFPSPCFFNISLNSDVHNETKSVLLMCSYVDFKIGLLASNSCRNQFLLVDLNPVIKSCCLPSSHLHPTFEVLLFTRNKSLHNFIRFQTTFIKIHQ